LTNDLLYDRAGQMTDFDFTSLIGDSGDADYSHDDTGQLTGSDYTGDWQSDESYQYDDNGNRETANGDTYTTGTNNQLPSDGTYRYQYDAEGNRTLRFVDADSSGTLTTGDTAITQYTWDHRNRLTKVSHFATQTDYSGANPDQIVEYAYDFGQRWVRKVLDSDGDGTADENRVFVQDGNQIILDFQDTTSPTNGATAADLSHRYLWGPATDQLLADEVVDDAGPEDVRWALTDHLGSVRDLAEYDAATDTTSIIKHVTYDAFGRITSDTAPAVKSLFLYTARPFDADTGLQNNLNRWYDAVVGRWVSEDPIGFGGGDGNLYRYVRNAPVHGRDPSGLLTDVVIEAPFVDGSSYLTGIWERDEACATLFVDGRIRGIANRGKGLYLPMPFDYDWLRPQGGYIEIGLGTGIRRGNAGSISLGDLAEAGRGGSPLRHFPDYWRDRYFSRGTSQWSSKVDDKHWNLAENLGFSFTRAGATGVYRIYTIPGVAEAAIWETTIEVTADWVYNSAGRT